MKAKVLIVDDETEIREGLVEILSDRNIEAIPAPDADHALAILGEKNIQVVISDIRMPGMDGMELLLNIRRQHPAVATILITGHATFTLAVEAVKAGAYDFLTKPFDIDQVKLTVKRALEHQRLIAHNDRLEREVKRLQGAPRGVIGESPAFRKVMDLVERVATTPSTVLITGETGTGKEVIARAIHDQSERVDKAFLSVNCGALNETLLESELFGFIKGAFTGADQTRPGLFESAHEGTFFLDEIGTIAPPVQAKLLRVLQEGEILRVGERVPRKVDVRVLAATNTNLKDAVAQGEFREDLYYRLNVVRIELPPLRERIEDIPRLAEAFRERLNQKIGRKVEGFSDGALEALKNYPWPGNVRELENAVERAVILSPSVIIQPSDLPSEVRQGPDLSQSADPPEMTLADLEKRHILRVLRAVDGHQGQASERLGINRRTLYRKIQEYGWQLPDVLEP